MDKDTEELDDILLVQRRLSLVFSIIGLAVSISNILLSVFVSHVSLSQILSDISFYLTLILTIPFIVFSFVKKKSLFVQIFQICVIAIAIGVSILDQYNGLYGLLFCIIALALLIKYKMLKKRFVLKVLVIYAILITLIEISAIQYGRAGAGFQVVMFLTFFIVICYLIFKSDFNRFINSEKKMKNEIQNLIVDRDILREQIVQKQQEYDEIESKYHDFKEKKNPFDFAKYNLTPSEINVIEVLVRERASNKEISEQLNIKESTVKQHMYRIFNKIGVDTRIQLIDLCEYNF